MSKRKLTEKQVETENRVYRFFSNCKNCLIFISGCEKSALRLSTLIKALIPLRLDFLPFVSTPDANKIEFLFFLFENQTDSKWQDKAIKV